jgi:hypothetical protein
MTEPELKDNDVFHVIGFKYPDLLSGAPVQLMRRLGMLLFFQIFAGNIILRHLMRANFLLVRVPGVFHALHHLGLERVSFLKQLVHTLRIRALRQWTIPANLPIARRPSPCPSSETATVSTLWLFPRTCLLSAPPVFPPVVFLPPAFVLTADFFGAAFFFTNLFLGVTLS